jgi:putative hydrolase of the HAD superfamily
VSLPQSEQGKNTVITVNAGNSVNNIEAIAFDADDTLWHNEDGFHSVEQQFVQLVSPHVPEMSAESILATLADTERRNVSVFGYGVKSFTFSMIETANSLTAGRIDAPSLAHVTDRIIQCGRWLLTRPTVLLPGTLDTLNFVASLPYRLLMITKGDSHHQMAKLTESGLKSTFHHIEVVSEKDLRTYGTIAGTHGLDMSRLVMVGNSVKSDILPVLEAGGHAVHIPYAVTWALERAELEEHHRESGRLHELSSMHELPALLQQLS